MAILDLFKINLKKPALSADELIKEEKKTFLNSSFESCYSRLESIELLNANGKVEDSSVIVGMLALDLINLSLSYFGKPKTSTGKDWKLEISGLKNDKLTSVYGKYDSLFALSVSPIETKEVTLEELESKLADLLSDLEKFYKNLKKTELSTALSIQIYRWKIQASILTLILFTIIGSIVYRKVRYPDLSKTDVKIYFLSKVEPGPKEENAAANKIVLEKKGEWVDYDFLLPKVTDVMEVRIDPTEQARVRLAAQFLKFYDSKGKLLYTHDFVWAEDLLPKDKLSYGAVSELKMTGKSIPGAVIEMESIGSDPFFHVKFPEIKGTAKVQIRMRHLEAYKKFKESL